MARSVSGNGRTGSFSEEEGSSSNGRSESRNPYLSNVRPENRSTLCSVMAQLTEDIQPSFESTLKSKAVSENCNVKFSCVVSGYPAPELKWYKDDMEMDRYCGLPKYEIHRNGKTHTLHIYKSTLDDAAIYQVSASNSKGIVSCSGVLEVGTMNEYKIHQRFFDKLKQKAEKKKSELEGNTKKGGKENVEKERPQISPERPPRKRHVPPLERRPAVKEPEAEEQLGAAAEPNGPVASQVLEKKISPPEETLAKKKIKITNGVDAEVNNSSSSSKSSCSTTTNMMGIGGENCYDGGIGLAQFLAETLQASEEKQNSSKVETPEEMDIPIVSVSKESEQEMMQTLREKQEKEEDYVREKNRAAELATERDKERERLLEMSHTLPNTKHGSHARHHNKAHKDQDHHNIQASLTSVLHSVKDFFFGKTKKDSHDHIENKEGELNPSPVSTPPSFRLQTEQNQVGKSLQEEVVPMEMDQPKEPSKSVDIEQQSASLKPHEHKHEASVQHTVHPPEHKIPPESIDQPRGESVNAEDSPVEVMEVSVGPEIIGPGGEMSLSGLQVLTEAEEKYSQIVSAIKEDLIHQQEPDHLVVSPQPYQRASREESSLRDKPTLLLQTHGPYEQERSPVPPVNVISESNSQCLGEAPCETLQAEKISSAKMGTEPDTGEGHSSNKSCEDEKTEVKSNKQSCSDINRSEITKLRTGSLEERIEPCQSESPGQVLSPLPAVATDSVEKDNVKEQTECTSLIQEMNVGFPLTVAPESLEKVDLNMQQECTSSVVEESTKIHNVSAIQSLNTGLRSSEEESKLKEVLISALDSEVKSCNDLRTQEVEAILESESTEAMNECVKLEVKTEKIKPVKADEFDESKSLLVTENKKHRIDSHQNGCVIKQGQPSLKIPEIQISTIEDTPDINPTVAGVNPMKHFVIPIIEIIEPELKEPTLPLTILALNKDESEPPTLQKHDTTHVCEVIEQNLDTFPSLLPTHKSMQNDSNLSPTDEIKEVAQLDDKRNIFELEPAHNSEQLPQMNHASIPVISVSCTDDKEDEVCVKARQADDTPTVPLFVVPPISVTCHESDSGLTLPTESEWTETETSAAPQRGTKQDADDENNTTAAEKNQSAKQKQVKTSEKGIKENTPSMLYEALIPKVGDNVLSFNNVAKDNIVPEVLKVKPLKEAKIENTVSVEDLQRNRPSVERLCFKPPPHPSLSPASLRKFMSRASQDSDILTNDKTDEDLSGGSTPTSSLSCESSPRLKRRDSLTLIRSATPEELASGARRKIFMPKPKEDGEGAVVGALDTLSKKESPYMSPSQARRAALLQAPTGQNTPPMERRSPLLSRRKATLEVPKVVEQTLTVEPVSTKPEEKPAENKLDPLKAPQVIRKIRGEPFPDASGHLKLWCQFFNVLSDSTIKWYRDEEEILEVKRSGGDESQVALAVVLASSHDCGVYGCTINNEYGTDTTDFLLSEDILSEILLKDDLEVGEEIEMTPLLFSKGLADCGSWGEKYFGRIMTETAQIGEGCAHKASKVKVIYGLDPVFESGSACIIKVQSPIAYGNTQESNLPDKNLQITKQECKVQNMMREYCKIFAAEARLIENFGFSLEVIPQYLMYRPANSVPYATLEADLKGEFLKYCRMDPKGRLITQTGSEVEQKCSTFQHWIHQWTHGNLLVTRLEGVETKITNVGVVTKSKGYQGLTEQGSPEVFEQFLTHHQCNYYCGLLGLRSLKSIDSQPTKIKGSRSPLLNRKLGSNSPQLQRKGQSPQTSRKASPKVTRRVQETEDNKSGAKPKPAVTVDVLEVSSFQYMLVNAKQ
ncbi:hypothetical protein NQZ68_008053 [Dissostichus eleginoides]|nr:hypothetical protein NQZ68_008053 [Dissostichus eleginoides]